MPATPRCIKLNNYWCVKSAGWAGEIAADADGHVAFASALEGAMVAVMLLRRYYLVYDRRSAQAIVSRWAPPQCGGFAAARKPAVALSLGGLATHGIGNTLRARWLATHSRGFVQPLAAAKPGGAPASKVAATPAASPAAKLAASSPVKPVRLRRSIIVDRPLRLMPAPEIAVGMGELPSTQAPLTIAALEAMPMFAPRARDAAQGAAPGFACADDGPRIRQYAERAVEGLAAGPDDDLQLFTPDGAPGANLARVLQNMAKVEIGPFAARGDLIDAAIEAEARQDRARRAGAAEAAAAAK